MPLQIFPYQDEGAWFMTKRRRAGLFDEPGVGKSAQAIRALDYTNSIRNLLVVPASARQNWVTEFAKFATRHRRIVKGENIHSFVAWQRGSFDTIIASYELAAKWAIYIKGECEIIDAVIIDEGHMLRNGETNRTKNILGPTADGVGGILQWAKFGWWLSGTPVWNDPKDIRTFLSFCGVMPLTENQFIRRYFNSHPTTYSTRNAVKPSMVNELRKLIGNNSIRRSLEETGVQLPPIFLTTASVDGDAQSVRDLLLGHPGLDEQIILALRENRPLSNLDADYVETLRRLIGEAKALPYAQMLLTELRSGLDKCVVFGIHRTALNFAKEYLWRHGIDASIVNGETGPKEDERNLTRFASDPTLRVLLCNIKKAGVSLTMTASCHIDMLESDWTDNGNFQAIKRVHRISQTRTVRARFIMLANSFDVTVSEIVAEKARNIAVLSN